MFLSFIYLFSKEFSYQLWVKPYVLRVSRKQLIIGNLVYDEARKYNHGLVIFGNILYFFVGNNFFDLSKISKKQHTHLFFFFIR